MKKIYFLLFAFLSIGQINSQVLNQNAGWPNAAWTITGSYATTATAFEANPTTTANFAFDDDDALVSETNDGTFIVVSTCGRKG